MSLHVIASDLSAEALAKAEAKQSSFTTAKQAGLLRRFAPRNDDRLLTLAAN